MAEVRAAGHHLGAGGGGADLPVLRGLAGRRRVRQDGGAGSRAFALADEARAAHAAASWYDGRRAGRQRRAGRRAFGQGSREETGDRQDGRAGEGHRRQGGRGELEQDENRVPPDRAGHCQPHARRASQLPAPYRPGRRLHGPARRGGRSLQAEPGPRCPHLPPDPGVARRSAGPHRAVRSDARGRHRRPGGEGRRQGDRRGPARESGGAVRRRGPRTRVREALHGEGVPRIPRAREGKAPGGAEGDRGRDESDARSGPQGDRGGPDAELRLDGVLQSLHAGY